MANATGRRVDVPAIVVGILLLALAGVVAWDASRVSAGFTYGISPAAMPNIVAIFLALLGVGHFVVALKDGLPEPEDADWGAVGWMSAGLFALVGAIWAGGGFILGSTLLFALTARSFGRRAILVDLVLGFVIATLVFLLFNRLLGLSLPSGLIEDQILDWLDQLNGSITTLLGTTDSPATSN